LAVDRWPDAGKTYQANFPDHHFLNIDVQDLTAARLVRELPARPTWVVGGPPCQGFSTVGKRLRHDPRNALVREFRRLVEVIEPEGFLVENVLGLHDMRFESAVARLFRNIGYDVSFMVLRAADYGVPQLRRRIVFVGHRRNGFFLGPNPSHKPDDYVTVWDAIGDLPELAPGESATAYDKLPATQFQRGLRRRTKALHGHTASSHPPHLVRAISFIPDGGNRSAIPRRYQPRSGFHNSYSRLFSKAPAVAITSNMGKPSATRCIHPFQNRGLTAREGARLQTFPDAFHFTGGMISQRLQVANAVPPLLGYAIAVALTDLSRWGAQPSHMMQQSLPGSPDEDLPPMEY
jgi:DNA (cytosine-5)-methyltransferase 1